MSVWRTLRVEFEESTRLNHCFCYLLCLSQPSATSPLFSTISILNISTKVSTCIRGQNGACRKKRGLVADGWLIYVFHASFTEGWKCDSFCSPQCMCSTNASSCHHLVSLTYASNHDVMFLIRHAHHGAIIMLTHMSHVDTSPCYHRAVCSKDIWQCHLHASGSD